MELEDGRAGLKENCGGFAGRCGEFMEGVGGFIQGAGGIREGCVRCSESYGGLWWAERGMWSVVDMGPLQVFEG